MYVSYQNVELSLFLIVLEENLTGKYFEKCWVFFTNLQHRGKSCFQEERMKSLLGLKLPKMCLIFQPSLPWIILTVSLKLIGSQVKQNILTSKFNFLGRWLTELSSAICSPFSLFLTRWTEFGFVLFTGFFGWPWSVTQGSNHWTSWCAFPCTFSYNDAWGKQCLKNFRWEHEVWVLIFPAQTKCSVFLGLMRKTRKPSRIQILAYLMPSMDKLFREFMDFHGQEVSQDVSRWVSRSPKQFSNA